MWVIRTASGETRNLMRTFNTCIAFNTLTYYNVKFQYFHLFIGLSVCSFLDIWHCCRWRAKCISAWRIIEMGSQINIEIPWCSSVWLHIFLARWHGIQRNYTQKQVIFLKKKSKNVLKFCIFFRPDLIDWRNVKTKNVRERLDSAFYIAEREYGVTRLLDPEGKWW